MDYEPRRRKTTLKAIVGWVIFLVGCITIWISSSIEGYHSVSFLLISGLGIGELFLATIIILKADDMRNAETT